MPEQGPIAHLAYDWMIVVYFFLGGMSAGAFLFSLVANYWQQVYKPLALKSAYLSVASLVAGMLILMIDLGQPLRVWRLYIGSNVRSPVSWGVWFLTIFLLIAFAYAYMLRKGKDDVAKKWGYVGIPFALLTATYTAMLLAQAPAVLIWHTSLLPIMFLNGSLISGIALVMLFSASEKYVEPLTKLGKFLAVLIVLEICMTFGEVLILANGSIEAVAAAKNLLSGEFAFLFLGVEILLGAVIPIVLLLKVKATALVQVIASVLILLGIYIMRYIIIVGGQTLS